MHEVSDPNVYVSTSRPGGWGLQYAYHIKKGFTMLAFRESEVVRIIASPDLEKYVTRFNDPKLKLTTDILLLRKVSDVVKEQESRAQLQSIWKQNHPDWEKEELAFPHYEILELYNPQQGELFAVTESDEIVENWTGKGFELIGNAPPYYIEEGSIYLANPKEYRVSEKTHLGTRYWLYDENGEPIKNLEELKEDKLKFLSRKSLIQMGEDVFRVEGCWYCHTDQTRTLVQDTVLNGSATYPAPPSSASEYIFQKVTFPGTRRIGPDLSRVGIKRPHRDWHMSHFWFPQSESKGSIMPSFKHFFDNDPSGTLKSPYGIPNYKFEAIFQYLMTKGTRITSPDQAWWLGKDPIQTLDIIEGRK